MPHLEALRLGTISDLQKRSLSTDLTQELGFWIRFRPPIEGVRLLRNSQAVTRFAPPLAFDFVDLPSIDGLPTPTPVASPSRCEDRRSSAAGPFSGGTKEAKPTEIRHLFQFSSLSETPRVSTLRAPLGGRNRAPSLKSFIPAELPASALAALARGSRGAGKKIAVGAEKPACRVPPGDAMLRGSCRFFGAGVSSSAAGAERRGGLRR
jgi:hypothetical protein